MGFARACYTGNVALAETIYCKKVACFPFDDVEDYEGFDPFCRTVLEKHIILANTGLWHACHGNRVEIAKLMFSKGATNAVDCMYYALEHQQIDFIILLYNNGASTPNHMFRLLTFTEEFIIKLFENQMPRNCFAKMQIYHDPSINNVLAKMNALQIELCNYQKFLPIVLLQLVSSYSVI